MKYASWSLIVAMSVFFASEALARGVFNYKPPPKGGSSLRMATNVRGTCPENKHFPKGLKIEVIAPEGLAHTIHAKPTLYWRVNKTVRGSFRLTIQEQGSGFSFPEPLVDDKRLLSNAVVEAGKLQSISLASLKTPLEKNTDYTWTVALVCDPNQRSLDIAQTGGIRYVDKPNGVSSKMRTRDLTRLAHNGVWYELFHHANSQQRQDLLEQVEL
jgi:hypothetical protein